MAPDDVVEGSYRGFLIVSEEIDDGSELGKATGNGCTDGVGDLGVHGSEVAITDEDDKLGSELAHSVLDWDEEWGVVDET